MQPLPPREISGLRDAELGAQETKARRLGWYMFAREVAVLWAVGSPSGEGGLTRLLLGTQPAVSMLLGEPRLIHVISTLYSEPLILP